MVVSYRDELGIISISTDKYAITFCDNIAYFSDEEGNDYKVNTEYLVSISQGGIVRGDAE